MLAIWIPVAAVGIYVAAAAATDLRMRRIPNYLTVPAAVSGLAYHSFAPGGWGPWVSLGGFGVGFLLLLLPYLAGGGGMGDVKLLAGLGAWLGTQGLLIAFVVSTLIAATIALAVTLRDASRSGAAQTGRRLLNGARRMRTGNRNQKVVRGVPFAVPVALSTLMLLGWFVSRGGL